MKKSKLKNNDRPWLKYYPEGVKGNLTYSSATMVGYLLEAVSKYPDSIAYEYYGKEVTFRSFYEEIRNAARCLKAQGVKKDDVVSICMPNTPSAVIMFYAINMVGAIASMIHPLSAENEIERYLNESNSTYLFVLDLVYEKVRNIIDNTSVNKVIIGSVGDDLKPIKKLLYKYKSRDKVPAIELTDAIMTFREFLNYGYSFDGEIACLREKDDPAVILYSGGTSGNPKGILLSNYNFNSLALQCALMTEVKPKDSILAILPIFHGFGLGVSIHTVLCAGCKIILVPDFSPKKFASIIQKKKPQIICAVPSLLESLARDNISKNGLASLKCVVSGGDSMSTDTKKLVDECLKNHGSSAEVRIGYGLTEASAATCLTPINGYKDGTIGIPFPDTYYKIVKPGTFIEVPTGTEGEICISGPTVMIGYINNTEETIKTKMKHDDGKIWLHTGDIGYMDKNGYVFFKQRLKRMIVSNGYNIYPIQIEKVLNQCDLVLTSVVIGIPHEYKVQVAKAFIVLKDGIEPSKETLKRIKNHCELNLSKYSLPYEYEFIDSIPKTLVGKVAYTKLAEKN